MKRIRHETELQLVRDELGLPALLLQHGRTNDVLAYVCQRPSADGIESTSTHDVPRACALAAVKETARGFRDLRKATSVLSEVVLFQDIVVVVRRAHESNVLVLDEVWDCPREPVGFGKHVGVESGEILGRAIVGCREGETRANIAGLVVMALTEKLFAREIHDVLVLRSAGMI